MAARKKDAMARIMRTEPVPIPKFSNAIEKWEDVVRHCNGSKGKAIDEDAKCSAIVGLCPELMAIWSST